MERNRDLFGFMINPIKVEEKFGESISDSEDSFTQFMFGSRRATESQQNKNLSNPLSFLDQIDIDDFFNHVDNLVRSAKELKPLFDTVKPFMEHFTDKK